MGLLRDQRLKLGLTLQNTVDSFGCFSTGAWSSIELGKVRLKSKYFQRCSELLQITMEDLREIYPLKVCPCGKSFDPSTNNHDTCSSKCWHKYNPEVPRYKQKKVDAGLCITCGKASALGGRKTCQECHDRHMKSQRKAKESLLEQGICRCCKANPVKIKKNGKPSQMCEECAKIHSDNAKAHYYATKNIATYDISKPFLAFSSWYWGKYEGSENLATDNIDRFIESVSDLFSEDQCNKETLYNSLAYVMNSYDYLMSILDTMNPSKHNKYYIIEEVTSAICVFIAWFVENNVINEDWDFIDGSQRIHGDVLGQVFYSVEEAVGILNTNGKNTKGNFNKKLPIITIMSKRIKEHRIKLGIKQMDIVKQIPSYPNFECSSSSSFNTIIKILNHFNLPFNKVCKDIPKPNSVFIFD